MSAAPDLRDEQGRFPKGVSGNPGGRPSQAKKVASQLAEAVRDVVDPDILAQLWLELATDPERRDADRLEASRMLADRGWGRAVDFTPQEGEDPLGISESRDRFVGRLQAVAPADDASAEGGPPPPAAPAR